MGFFDSLTNILGGVSGKQAGKMADNARLDLGNIFLPGGMGGGAMNTVTQGGFNGSPLNEADYTQLAKIFPTISDAASFQDVQTHVAGKNYRGTDFSGGLGLSDEAQNFLQANWQNMGGGQDYNRQLGGVDWSRVKGAPAYAQPPGGTPGAPGTDGSALGDLEPARGMFASLATDQAGQVGANSSGNILELLRKQAQPQEDRAFNRINNNLFMRGRLGANDSATGEAYQGFSRGIAEADTSRQIAALGMSDQLQTSALQRSLGAAGGAGALTTLSTLPFDMALKLAMAKSGSATNAAGIANSGTGLLDMWSKFIGGGR